MKEATVKMSKPRGRRTRMAPVGGRCCYQVAWPCDTPLSAPIARDGLCNRNWRKLWAVRDFRRGLRK
jgi:hypothetical protein